MKRILLLFLMLLVGFAAGYLCQGVGAEGGSAEPEENIAKPSARIADQGGEAALKALRKRIADLEKALVEAKRPTAATESADEKTPPDEAREPRNRGFGPGADFRREMERLAKEDPKRYAQMTNRIARMQNHHRERALSRHDYLSSLDFSSLGRDAQRNHTRLLTAIERREALMEKMLDLELSEDERMRNGREMHQLMGEMRELNANERANLFTMLAGEMGCSEKQTADLVTALGDIVEATNDHMGMPPPGAMPPPGGAPPGGPAAGK